MKLYLFSLEKLTRVDNLIPFDINVPNMKTRKTQHQPKKKYDCIEISGLPNRKTSGQSRDDNRDIRKPI